jgi:hypothetical protein
MQPSVAHGGVWFPTLVLEPVPGHAAKSPEPGSRKTDLESVFSQLGSRESCACTRERAAMQVRVWIKATK